MARAEGVERRAREITHEEAKKLAEAEAQLGHMEPEKTKEIEMFLKAGNWEAVAGISHKIFFVDEAAKGLHKVEAATGHKTMIRREWSIVGRQKRGSVYVVTKVSRPIDTAMWVRLISDVMRVRGWHGRRGWCQHHCKWCIKVIEVVEQ